MIIHMLSFVPVVLELLLVEELLNVFVESSRESFHVSLRKESHLFL